ncbi:MAG: FHA domain-containing protein [Oscillospiraceae bacterium]|jgi:hypothetical protein|nr:FHA domain-containing protein [Oscillospiraceae bacterium]
MQRNDLSVQELGNAKILVYKGDVESLNFNSNLPNILTFVRTTFVEVPLCYFDVTGKAAFSEMQRYSLDKYDLLKVIKTAAELGLACKEYGVDLNSILFDLDFVFVDGDFNAYFIPLDSETEDELDFRLFLKTILVNSIIDARYSDNFVQLLLNCFNEPSFSLEGLVSLIDRIVSAKHAESQSIGISSFINEDPKKKPAVDKNMVSTPSRYTDTIISDMLKKGLSNAKASAPAAPPPAQEKASQDPRPVKINSGFAPNISHTPFNSTYIGDFERRSYAPLAAAVPAAESGLRPDKYMGDYGDEFKQKGARQSAEQACLIEIDGTGAAGTPARIPINYNPFRVGRNPELVDFVVNSPYVGRLHALIIDNNGEYALVDKKSTNGTFVNDQQLKPEQKMPIHNGDIIRFAQHAYQFSID